MADRMNPRRERVLRSRFAMAKSEVAEVFAELDAVREERAQETRLLAALVGACWPSDAEMATHPRFEDLLALRMRVGLAVRLADDGDVVRLAALRAGKARINKTTPAQSGEGTDGS